MSMQRSLVKCFQFQVIHTISPPIAPVPIELERIPENPIRFVRVHIAIFTFSWKFKQRQILAIYQVNYKDILIYISNSHTSCTFIRYMNVWNVQNMKPVQIAQVSYFVHFMRLYTLNFLKLL